MLGRCSIPLLKRLHGSTTPGRGCARRSDALQLRCEGLKANWLLMQTAASLTQHSCATSGLWDG